MSIVQSTRYNYTTINTIFLLFRVAIVLLLPGLFTGRRKHSKNRILYTREMTRNREMLFDAKLLVHVFSASGLRDEWRLNENEASWAHQFSRLVFDHYVFRLILQYFLVTCRHFLSNSSATWMSNSNFFEDEICTFDQSWNSRGRGRLGIENLTNNAQFSMKNQLYHRDRIEIYTVSTTPPPPSHRHRWSDTNENFRTWIEAFQNKSCWVIK